jgi:RNA polymerase sigma factor (sigma-70 family)
MSNVGDPLLRSRASSADELERLYVTERRRLVALAAAITLDRSLADEVVHDAFAGLQRHFATVTNPAGYLQRAVVHRSISVIRRRRTAARFPLPVARVTISPEIDDTWKAVTELPPRERAVVVLRYWQDMSENEIATTLGWPNGTVKSTLHRALRRLKGELQR